jgi:type IV pilus assembly protein PilW
MMGPNSRQICSNTCSSQAGFTLVEILVGLGIGLLATVVIIQVMSVFEVQRRTTTGTADAQTNGGIALYVIARELQMAGYPMLPVTNSALECTAVGGNVNGTAATVGRLSPVTIVNDVAGAAGTPNASPSDTLTLRYGTSLMGGVPTQTTTILAASAAPTVATLVSNLGCSPGDVTLIINGTTCTMSTVTGVAGTTNVTLATTPAVPAGVNIACLGSWNEVTYAVNNGNLERNGVPVVSGVVNLQVQYGVAAAGLINADPNFNKVALWVDAINVGGIDWSNPGVVDRNRIKAIRIAVVARNAKKELGTVSTACSSTTTAAPTGVCAWAGTVASPAPTVDVSAGEANWDRYRYRVFETIIPLRNVIWSKDTL